MRKGGKMDHTILIVDDVEVNREILNLLFCNDYKIIEAEDGFQAIEKIEDNINDISAILLDIIMPNLDGFGVLDYMQAAELMSKIPVILITGDTSNDLKKRGYDLGVSDIIEKPFDSRIVRRRVQNLVDLYFHKNNLEQLVENQTIEIMKKNKKINEMNYRIIDTLGTMVEFRDLESGGHIMRVREFTAVLLKYVQKYYPEYGITDEMADIIIYASSMHDIGKIAIPDNILLKPGRLTEDEFEIMKTHTVKGCDILDKFLFIDDKEFLNYCYEICLYHHEKYDGRGYPRKLKGDEIPIAAQIVSLADVYDALVSERVYKAAFKPEQAFEMILNGECGVFSPKLLDCFKMVKNSFECIAKNQ